MRQLGCVHVGNVRRLVGVGDARCSAPNPPFISGIAPSSCWKACSVDERYRVGHRRFGLGGGLGTPVVSYAPRPMFRRAWDSLTIMLDIRGVKLGIETAGRDDGLASLIPVATK
jgi:hypothetical protein